MKKLYLLILMVTVVCAKLSAQSFYVTRLANSANHTPNVWYELLKVTIGSAGPFYESVNTCNQNFYSIAATSTAVYWVDSKPFPIAGVDRPTLYRGDLDAANSSVSNCAPLTPLTVPSNSLSVKDDKAYYTIDDNLAVVDLKTNRSTVLGKMGFFANGDLTFYKGELYMASTSGLVQVNIADPSKSFVYMSINAAYGLITVSAGANKNKVYSFVMESNNTAIYELDIDNKRELGLVGFLPFLVLDAASPNEDGSVLGVNIEKVNVRQDCGLPNSGLAEVVTTGPDDTFRYRLSNGQTNATGIFGGLAPGPYTVEVTSLGRRKTASFIVPPYSSAPPKYTYNIVNRSCNAPGEIKFQTPTGSSNYKIQLGNNAFTLDHVFSNLTADNYHFTIINENGCQVDQLDVSLPRECPIQFDRTLVAKECAAVNKGSITVLTNAYSDVYSYTLNGTMNTTGIFNMLDPGKYDIQISSPDDNRIVSGTIPDYSLSRPLITYKLSRPACGALGTIMFETANSQQYQVKYGTGVYQFSRIIMGLAVGTAHFAITDLQGCIVDEIDVNVLPDECSPVIFPTAFTPNGDGINDLFRADPKSKASDFTLKVFDRTGNMLYQSADLHQGWNGERNGRPLPFAVYYYTATFTDQTNKRVTKSGSLTLIR